MSYNLSTDSSQSTIPLYALTLANLDTWLATQTAQVNTWAEACQLRTPGNYVLIPDDAGQLAGVAVHIDVNKYAPLTWAAYAPIVNVLPVGYYQWQLIESAEQDAAALAFGLASYQFARYKTSNKVWPQLVVDAACYERVMPELSAIYLVRDLINTPTEDLYPLALAQIAKTMADQYQASYTLWQDNLLELGFPSIHTVGRASAHAPCLIDLRWGDPSNPKLTLVGKGVCFDSGGLDIKPASGMLTMKKDMGGAAHVLGLAQLIMQRQLPVSLHVLVPAVENAISGNAYRPGDVIRSRSGKTIEITNTDAEGRVVLADAITYALESNPDLLIDFATLTGAARVAVGTDMPAVFSKPESLSFDILAQGKEVADPVWPMPLFVGYRELNQSVIADIVNSPLSPYAGAITAALFLENFVGEETPWMHVDLMAWNLKSKPGRPEGGEAMGLRAMYAFLAHWVAQR